MAFPSCLATTVRLNGSQLKWEQLLTVKALFSATGNGKELTHTPLTHWFRHVEEHQHCITVCKHWAVEMFRFPKQWIPEVKYSLKHSKHTSLNKPFISVLLAPGHVINTVIWLRIDHQLKLIWFRLTLRENVWTQSCQNISKIRNMTRFNRSVWNHRVNTLATRLRIYSFISPCQKIQLSLTSYPLKKAKLVERNPFMKYYYKCTIIDHSF